MSKSAPVYETWRCKHQFQGSCLDPETLQLTTMVWRGAAQHPRDASSEPCTYCMSFRSPFESSGGPAAHEESYDTSKCKHGFQGACLDLETLGLRTEAWRFGGAPLEPCGYCAFFQKPVKMESESESPAASDVESECGECGARVFPYVEHSRDACIGHLRAVVANLTKKCAVEDSSRAGLKQSLVACDGCGRSMATDSPEAALEKEIAAHRRMTEDDASVARVCVARIATLAAEPITPRSMLLIERFVKIAREAWAIEKGVFFEDRGCGMPYEQLGGVPNDSFSVGPASYGFNPGATPVAPVYMGPNLSNVGLGSMGGPMMPPAAGAAENFGVTAMRELVSAFSAKKPEEIVRAIAAAKELGQHDLAVRLEATLGVAPAAAPTPVGAPKIPTVV